MTWRRKSSRLASVRQQHLALGKQQEGREASAVRETATSGRRAVDATRDDGGVAARRT